MNYMMKGLAVGDRVKIHPAHDLFMRGVRYAEITKVGRKWLHVFHYGSQRSFMIAPEYVDPIPPPLEIPRSWTKHGGTDHYTTA